MASANEILQDDAIKNQHLVEKYKNEATSVMLLFFKRMEKLVDREITLAYDADGILIEGKVALKKKIREIQELELSKMKKTLISDSEKFLGIEANLYKSQLDEVFDSVSDFISIKNVNPASLKKTFEKTKISMDKGQIFTLASLWGIFIASVKTKTMQNIDSAYQLEKSSKDFHNDVTGGFKTNRNQLNAVVAVVIQHAYLVAVQNVNKVNARVISGYLYNAILDERTSEICRELNGGTWFYDHPEASTLPYQLTPPQHYRCRSFTTPITRSYQDLGIPTTDLNASQKELLSGKTPNMPTYFEWFEKQNNTTKKQILGKTRYNAYQSGSLRIDQFYDNGQKLRLDQLKK